MTLVENAIKHGVAPVGRGRIAVRASQAGGRLRVEVEDDGRGLAEPIGQGVGLANMRERLRALYGDAARARARGPRARAARAPSIEVPAMTSAPPPSSPTTSRCCARACGRRSPRPGRSSRSSPRPPTAPRRCTRCASTSPAFAFLDIEMPVHERARGRARDPRAWRTWCS